MSTADRASLAPRYTFAETLAEQESQLRDNPMVRRMAASRKAMEGDPHRPLYHYVNPENTLNDPSGLCFWQGRWHLFYQGYPPEDSRPHWGHAVSEDLIHWRDLPYAIYPDPEDCCFSGATLVEDERVIAIYHGTQVGNMVAVSSDPLLLNWEKVTGQPVIPIPEHDGSPQRYTVFDPCIWKRDGVYYSLSGGTLTDGPDGQRVAADFVFRSEDLETWEYLHPLTEDDMFTLVGDDGACPYFWPIGDRHMLLFFSHMSGGQYLLGDYDDERDKLVVTSHGLFNFGPSTPSGVHAPSATPDGQGGIIVLFNMNPGLPTEGWNQIMTLPKRLTLAGDDDVRIEPAGEIESLRYDHRHIGATTLPANEEVVLEGIEGSAMELVLELDPGDAPMVELDVLRSPGKEEYAHRLLQGPRVQGPEPFRPVRRDTPHRAARHPRLSAAKARRAVREPADARLVLLVHPPRRTRARARDGPSTPRSGRAAPAPGIHRPQRGGGVRERQAVRRRARLPRARRQHRRLPPGPGQRRQAALPRRLADAKRLHLEGA